jgi:hypothetical protein
VKRQGASVGGGYGVDDGETEAEALPVASAFPAYPLKWLQQPVDGRCRHGRAGVGDRQDGSAILGGGHDVNAAVVDVVAQCVSTRLTTRDSIRRESPAIGADESAA